MASPGSCSTINSGFRWALWIRGIWPDGLYTAPTDDALRFDIEFLKRAGFNLARKHVKVEPERWYYWCDRLGLLVWQDMPSGNNATPEGRTQFESRIAADGRGALQSSLASSSGCCLTKAGGNMTPNGWRPGSSRWIPRGWWTDASGWTDKRVGDLIDVHSYPGPDCRLPEAGPGRGAG